MLRFPTRSRHPLFGVRLPQIYLKNLHLDSIFLGFNFHTSCVLQYTPGPTSGPTPSQLQFQIQVQLRRIEEARQRVPHDLGGCKGKGEKEDEPETEVEPWPSCHVP